MKKLILQKLKADVLWATKIFAVALLGFATYGLGFAHDHWAEVEIFSALYFASSLLWFALLSLLTWAALVAHFWITWRFRRFSGYTIERTYSDGTKKRFVLTLPRWIDNLPFEEQKRVIYAQIKGQR